MKFDVVIVGAGPAGCLAARDLARSGLKVGLFDESGKKTLGKPVVVEVENTMLQRVGVPAPGDNEIPYHTKKYRMFSPAGEEILTVNGDHPSISLQLDRFARRLLADAEKAGAKFFGGHRALDPIVEGSRVQGAVFRTGNRRKKAVAPLVIDATGFRSALVRKLPPDLGMEFVDEVNDVVEAENYLYRIRRKEAERAVREGRQGDEEIWFNIGSFGAYSTEFAHLSLSRGRAYILVGRKAGGDGPSIAEMVSGHKKRLGYYGRKITGGRGDIRIRRSLGRLVTEGFMVVGEAACQVIPINGSGVSSALLAGHLAARAAARALHNSGPSTAALWGYPRQYQQERGGLLASFDVVRRTMEKLTADQVSALMNDGIMQAEDLLNSMVPRSMTYSPGSVPGRLAGLIRNPDLIPPIARMVLVNVAVGRHYSRYPEAYDPVTFAAWRKKEKRLFALLS